jgi:hypothetical protein
MTYETARKTTGLWVNSFLYRFTAKQWTRDRFLHILRHLHFADNENAINNNDPKYDRLWKIRRIFDILNDAFSKYYASTEHLAADEVIMLFKGRVNFKQYLRKRHKRFRIKIHKLCVMSGYTYNMDVYFGKNRTRATADMTSTHATARLLTTKVDINCTRTIFFSSPNLIDDLTKIKINCWGTVRTYRKGMPQDLLPPLKRGDILSRTRNDLTAMGWKDKRDVYILTSMHHPPTNGNFYDEHGNALKLVIVQDYNKHGLRWL